MKRKEQEIEDIFDLCEAQVKADTEKSTEKCFFIRCYTIAREVDSKNGTFEKVLLDLCERYNAEVEIENFPAE